MLELERNGSGFTGVNGFGRQSHQGRTMSINSGTVSLSVFDEFLLANLEPQ